MLSVKFDSSKAQAKLRRLRTGMPAAVARALTRAGESATVALARAVSSDTGVKVGGAKGAIRATREREGQPRVIVTAIKTRLPLSRFNARQTKRGVTARLRGGKGRYAGAFLVRFKSGHVGVMQRAGKGKLPLQQLHGPSIAHVAEKFAPTVGDVALETLAKRIVHEMKRLAGGRG